jgi:outer membrane protein OmpA-like peptidoglycan-associated protein
LALIKRQVIEQNLGAAGLVDLMQAQRPALLEKIETKYAIVLGSPSSQSLLGLTEIEAATPRRASAEPAAHGSPINASNKLSLAAKKALPWVLGVSLLLSLIVFLNACDSRVAGTARGADGSAKDSVAKELTNKVQQRLPALEKIYFDAGNYETPDDTSRKVRGILEYAKVHGNSRLTITGFHDTLQETEPVQRLARQRSMAVRSVLISAGIAEDRVVMLNAQEPIASVGERQATRVEVSISQ